jgi:hypothetical protein
MSPSKSEKQRKFMGAELQRAREGKRTETGMSENQLSDFARKPVIKAEGNWDSHQPKNSASSCKDCKYEHPDTCRSCKIKKSETPSFIKMMVKEKPIKHKLPTGSEKKIMQGDKDHWKLSNKIKKSLDLLDNIGGL